MSDAMATAERYHERLWQQIRPFLGQRILDIGVGHGQYALRMLRENRCVMAADIDATHIAALTKTIQSTRLSTLQLDLESPGRWTEAVKTFAPDTAVLVNVLEHIQSDDSALTLLRSVCPAGCGLVIFVPALSRLYNRLDAEAGHYRRYSRTRLRAVVEDSGWTVRELRYVNFPGVLGWMAAGALGRITRQATSLNAPGTNSLIRLYDRWLTRLQTLTDPFMKRTAGLSLLAFAKKEAR